MKIEITTVVDAVTSERELLALRDWLMRESPRPGTVSMTAAQGELAISARGDLLEVALGSGGAISVLAGAMSAWIQTRRQTVKMVLKRPDGVSWRSTASVKDPDLMIERFLKVSSDS